MKKTLAIILALVLTLGLASSALADDSWPTLRVEVFDRDTPGLKVAEGWQAKYAQEHFGDPNQINIEFVGYARWGGEDGLIAADLAAHIAPTSASPTTTTRSLTSTLSSMDSGS